MSRSTQLGPRYFREFGDKPEVRGPVARWGGRPWTLAKARKAATCAYSGKAIKPGDDVFRPLTNDSWRMHRVLAVEWLRPPNRA